MYNCEFPNNYYRYTQGRLLRSYIPLCNSNDYITQMLDSYYYRSFQMFIFKKLPESSSYQISL